MVQSRVKVKSVRVIWKNQLDQYIIKSVRLFARSRRGNDLKDWMNFKSTREAEKVFR